MNTQSILEAYENIAKKHKLPKMIKVKLKILPKTIKTQEELHSAIKDFSPTSGWLTLQSEVKYFEHELKLDSDDTILNAEMMNNKNHSMHIRQNGENQRYVTQYKTGEGESYLMQTHSQLCNKPELKNINYECFWKYEKDLGTACQFARFVGFAHKEQSNG